MNKQLLCLYALLITVSAAAQVKGKDDIYRVADSVNATSLYTELRIIRKSATGKIAAYTSAEDFNLSFKSKKGKKYISFGSSKYGKPVASAPGVMIKGRTFTWDYNWEYDQLYKLLLMTASDSADNKTIATGYVFLPLENKWKMLGTIELPFIRTIRRFYLSDKTSKKYQVEFSNHWLLRKNNSWKAVGESTSKPPVLRPMSHADSLSLQQTEEAVIRQKAPAALYDNGVFYEILKEGTGEQVSVSDTVVVHYKGWLLSNDSVFDQTKDKPATFPLSRLITGWQLGLPHAKVGGKTRLYIPSGLAYGIRTFTPAIPPNSILVFDVEVIAAKEKRFSGNPLFAGWYADPEGAIFNNRYWIYPTYSAPYEKQVFFDAFSSSDLVNWTKHSSILDTSAIKWAKKAMWAPSVIAHKSNYYFFFGANDIQSNQEYGGIGVAVANNPAGPYKDHLGKPLVAQFYNGAQPIDQFVFKDKNGEHYLIYGGWRHCNIARLNDDFTGFIPFADQTIFKEITPKGYVEGPFMFTRNNKYYFMWSEGGWTGPDYSVAYAVSNSPFGPFERIGKILQQDPKIATGAGHHSVINPPGTDEWYIIYHRRPLTETSGNSRVTCIERLSFDEQGLIQPVTLTNTGVEKRTTR